MTDFSIDRSAASPAPTAARTEPLKTCSGPCRRRLPLSAFSVNSARRDGRRSECRECGRARRGPRGRDPQRSRSLERELLELLGTFGTPPLSDILSRALDEVRQVGASGPALDEQVESVRRAVMFQGCRRVDEIVEETGLYRGAVDRALERLLAARVVEARDGFRLPDVAEEAGRPAVEYHPRRDPRGEGFSRLFQRQAVEDDLL